MLSVSKCKRLFESVAGECRGAVHRAVSSSTTALSGSRAAPGFVGAEKLGQWCADVTAKEVHCASHKVPLNIKNKQYLQYINLLQSNKAFQKY